MKLKTPYKFALLFAGLAVLVYVSLLGARVITYTNGYFGRHTLDLALIRAVEENDHSLVRVLLLFGATPDFVFPNSGASALTTAASLGNTWAIQKLLDHGANPDGASDIVDNLNDPNVSIPYDPNKATPIYYLDRPLHWAAKNRRRDAVELLRANGARYEFVDALFQGDESFVRDELQKDDTLETTLQKAGPRLMIDAIEYYNLPALELMLKLGVDPNAKNEYGHTPLEAAKRIGRSEILSMLEKPQPTVVPTENE